MSHPKIFMGHSQRNISAGYNIWSQVCIEFGRIFLQFLGFYNSKAFILVGDLNPYNNPLNTLCGGTFTCMAINSSIHVCANMVYLLWAFQNIVFPVVSVVQL